MSYRGGADRRTSSHRLSAGDAGGEDGEDGGGWFKRPGDWKATNTCFFGKKQYFCVFFLLV